MKKYFLTVLLPLFILIMVPQYIVAQVDCTSPNPVAECTPPSVWDEDVVATGSVNWKSLGLGDANTVSDKIRISGSGTVTVGTSDGTNLIINNSAAVVFIDGPTLVIENGNLQLTASGARYIQHGGALQTKGNFQQDGNTVVCIIGTEVEIGEEAAGTEFVSSATFTSANWQNSGGYRYLKDNCINVTHSFQISSNGSGSGISGVDVILDNCIEIGDAGINHATDTDFGFTDGDDSGDWQSDNYQFIGSTTIVIANGSFQIQSGNMTLCDVNVKVNKSGHFQQNSGHVNGDQLCVAVEDIFEKGCDDDASCSWNVTNITWFSDINDAGDLDLPPGAGSEADESTILSDCFSLCVCADRYEIDWGDLPDEYKTLKSSNGAGHIILPTGNPFLGLCCDPDSDGCPCEQAGGDDDDGNDDGDGVEFLTLNNTGFPGKLSSAPIVDTWYATFVVIAGTSGYLNAWIDWNANYDFDDPGEYIVQDVFYAAGPHTIEVTTTTQPADVFYHRWRFTENPDEATAHFGLAPNGEVEDYYSTNVPLPVELSSFTAEVTTQGVLLEWTTESEIENLGFILERRSDGTEWAEIASYKSDSALEGQGNTSSSTDYEYLDVLVQADLAYEYRLADVNYDGVVTYLVTRRVSVDASPLSSIIDQFTVLPAYPNPFNPNTTIRYGIPILENGNDQFVQVAIYDITGQLINKLIDQKQSSGWHSIGWNGTNQSGENVPAGIYLSKITAGDKVKTTKLMLLK